MPYEFIKYEKRGPTAYVTVDRPQVLNALHPPTNAEMGEAFADFRDDPETLVAILTGQGDRAFCAGDDLKYQAEHGTPGEPYPEADRYPFGGITSNFTCFKPIIAAVNGYAMGGGLELALACDIIVAADHAQLGLPEVRVGLAAGAGGPHRLPRQVPIKIAMGMLLAGTPITAQQAHRWGLVNEVVPMSDLMPTAERWASEIIAGAPLAIRATKQMASEGLELPLDKAMGRSYTEYEKAMASDDYMEGPKAFAEKRKPVWKGA